MTTPELYKDKVEVSLDGRQIFYLFFGGAVIVGIVFVLGVLVGRRVEARGHVDRARTTASADPLAALDRLDGNSDMAFRGALSGKDSAAPVDKTIAELSKERGVAKAPAVEAKADVKSDDKKSDDKKSEAKADVKKDEPKKSEDKKSDDKKSEDKKSEAKSDEKKSESKKDDKKSDEKKSASNDEKKDERKDEKSETKKEEKKSERFTLQLSSFQDRAEAEAYLAKVKDQGFTAQITQAEVDGKGTFYRVRMGSYRSLDAANSAKTEFERSGKSASVMKL